MCANPEHHSDEECESSRDRIMNAIANSRRKDLAPMIASAAFALVDAHSTAGVITPLMSNFVEMMVAFAKRIDDPDLTEISNDVSEKFHSALIVFEAEYEAWSASNELGEGA